MGDVNHRPERKISESTWVDNTSIYATTEQINQFSVSRNIDENHIPGRHPLEEGFAQGQGNGPSGDIQCWVPSWRCFNNRLTTS